MEFAELILISKIDNVILHSGIQLLNNDNNIKKIEGTLCVTGHHLILSSREGHGHEHGHGRGREDEGKSKGKGKQEQEQQQEDEEEQELCILQQNIDNIEKKYKNNDKDISNTINNSNNINLLIIKCKDFRIIQLEIKNNEHFILLYKTLEQLINIIYKNECNIKLLYPFYYRLPINNIKEHQQHNNVTTTTTTTILNTISSNSNTSSSDDNNINLYNYIFILNDNDNDDWRITNINKHYNICKSYSKLLIVPKVIDDRILIESSKYRENGRLPIISYKHKYNGTILLHASQPLVGVTNKRCKADELLLNTILSMNQKSGYIFDLRSQQLAQQFKLKGGGYELDINYPQWKRIHKNIYDKLNSGVGGGGGLSMLSESLLKLLDACNDVNCTTDKWLTKLNNSEWLQHIFVVLNTACIVAQSLHHDNVNVLVHGTYGIDLTILITSLTQIILNPECRTIYGFQLLIEREWIQNGYPFYKRHLNIYNNNNINSNSNSIESSKPVFLLFLDCVQQLHYQFPCSFQFTTHFLILLFEHSYFSQYGTFIGNNEYEREILLNLYKSTTSLWVYLNQSHIIQNFINSMYELNEQPIWPSIAPISFILWSELYLRWSINLKPIHDSYKAINHIQQHHLSLYKQVIELRKQLIELQENYEYLLKK